MEYPTIYLHPKDNAVLANDEKRDVGLAMPNASYRVTTHDAMETVGWVRQQVPPVRGDEGVVAVLAAFYEKFDPGAKSEVELHAISSKYSGKEERLYHTLSEKYGEHPIEIAAVRLVNAAL